MAAVDPTHDVSCEDWCNHCEVCGDKIMWGARCPDHLVTPEQIRASTERAVMDPVAQPRMFGWLPPEVLVTCPSCHVRAIRKASSWSGTKADGTVDLTLSCQRTEAPTCYRVMTMSVSTL